MRAVRRRLRAFAWLGILAIIALAAGPTVSRLLLPAADAGSAHHHHQHSAMASGTAPAAPHAPAHEHALEHCGLCLLAAHAFTFVQERLALPAFVECARPVLTAIAPAIPRLRL